ncbi:MAG: pitrilysin family protein, partial [Nitrososphaeraceae archaeon]|nr:pitrilysin family protein [Nitrososphaeraceae archaeon]
GKLNALELAEKFDMLGAHFSVGTDNDTIKLTLQTLSENFQDALQLYCMVLQSPHLNETEFEREKRKISTRLVQLSDDPDYLANTSFEYLLLGKKNYYAYPVLGSVNNLDLINNSDVKDFYKKYFSPENTSLVVVGNWAENETQNLLQKYLGSWAKNNIPKTESIKQSENIGKIFIFDKKDSVQTEIRIGRISSLRSEKNYYSKLLLNTIFGGQFTSRLNLNLREKHGYTYGVVSRFNYYKETAFFYISTSVGIENTKNALDQIFIELDKINQSVKDTEIQFAKSSIVKKYPMNFETFRQISSNIVSKINFDLPDDFFENYINRINNVTKDQINIAVADNLIPDEMIIVLIGDKNKLMGQFKDYRNRELIIKDYR